METTTTTTLENGHTVTRETRDDGTWFEITNDPQGLEVRYEDSDGYWESNQYDEQGRWVRYENAFGRVETYTYDTAGARTTTVVVA